MRVLNKEEFLQEVKLKTKEVQVGSSVVLVSEMSASDLVEVRKRVETADGKPDMYIFDFYILLFTIVNPDGTRMFSDDELETVKNFSPKVKRKLCDAALRLNGLSGDEGNDSGVTSDDSISGESQLPLDIDTPTS